MKNSEVIEQLKLTLDYCMRADPDAYHEIGALQHAVRCVELMPELVEALEEAKEFLVCEDSHMYQDEIDRYRKLLEKAKELIK